MRIIHAFTDINMSNGHTGLSRLLLKQAKTAALKDDECAVFVNRAWTALKMLVPGGVLIHLRRPANKPIDPGVIKHLPSCVSGANLDYTKALETLLVKDYKLKVLTANDKH